MHTKDMDLNLLRVFDAVYRRGSVSRAALALNLTQPTVSQGLARLRHLLNDPLFVRAPGGVKPSPKAQGMADAVRQALALLETAFSESAGFDPGHSQRCFHLHMSDIGEGRFLPELMRDFSRCQACVNLDSQSLPSAELADALDSGRIDFAFGFLPKLAGSSLRSAHLLHDRYCVLLREGHPFLRLQLSGAALLAALQQLEFVAVRSHADTLRILQVLGLHARVRMSTEHFTVLPAIVRATDLAVVMPLAIAQSFDVGYAVVEPALPGRDFSVSLHWSHRYENEPGNRWFRERVLALYGGQGAQV